MFSACAVQSSPNGGPKDTEPPQIVEQIPALGTKNFSRRELKVVFNEYIQEKGLRAGMTSSPEIKSLSYKIQGKELVLDWDETLRENTTYRVDLGDHIGDLNENNPYLGLQFVFSTGNSIDSLRIRGQISMEKKGDMSTLTAGLFSHPVDSIFKPVFSAHPDKKGSFGFDYLPQDSMTLLVFEDLNFNRVWDTASEQVGLGGLLLPAVDTPLYEVSLFPPAFEHPKMDSSATDSIVQVMDTIDSKALSVLQLKLPPHAATWHIWIVGENGYWHKSTYEPARDSVLHDLPRFLAGKYTLSGFEDRNEDGVWNGFSWGLNRLPENILATQQIPLKANWDIEVIVPDPKAEPVETDEEESTGEKLSNKRGLKVKE